MRCKIIFLIFFQKQWTKLSLPEQMLLIQNTLTFFKLIFLPQRDMIDFNTLQSQPTLQIISVISPIQIKLGKPPILIVPQGTSK